MVFFHSANVRGLNLRIKVGITFFPNKLRCVRCLMNCFIYVLSHAKEIERMNVKGINRNNNKYLGLSDVKTRAAMITFSCSNIVNDDPDSNLRDYFSVFCYTYAISYTSTDHF